jgi:nucleoside-diphosphate-sugar epimerase
MKEVQNKKNDPKKKSATNKSQRPTILITGGTGFLGVHLARFFLKKKYKVILLDIAPLTADDIKGKVTVIDADIRNYKDLEKAMQDVDFVVHAAAALPIHHERKYIFDVNVNGTRQVLKASLKNKVKRLVYISSTAMYGVPRTLPEKETDAIYPIGHYGESKAAGEKLCKEFEKKGLSINILRPKTFLGPERLGVFTIWFEAIFNNKPVFILGNGENLYQLLEVQDLCEVIEKALLAKVHGEIFNVGADDFGTWKDNLTDLINHAKSKSKLVTLPIKPTQMALYILETFNLSPIVAWHYKTFPVNSYVSTEKAKKKFGFKPTKGNKDILIESYDWYKKHRKEFIGREGKTHRTIWNFKIVDFAQKFFR